MYHLYRITVGFSPTFIVDPSPPIFVRFDGAIIAYYYYVFNYVLHCLLFCYVWWLCIAINVSVQYNGGLLSDIIAGLFQGCTGLWTAGCWLARRLHQLKASTTMDLGISIFLFCTMCGLEKPGLVDQNWSECNLPALLLRTLVAGRRQQSESTEAALDME